MLDITKLTVAASAPAFLKNSRLDSCMPYTLTTSPGGIRAFIAGDAPMTTVNRRKFLTTLGATAAVTIVPRRVLGGRGYVPPSDMVLLAQVGCGTQSQRQVNCGLVERPDLQF